MHSPEKRSHLLSLKPQASSTSYTEKSYATKINRISDVCRPHPLFFPARMFLLAHICPFRLFVAPLFAPTSPQPRILPTTSPDYHSVSLLECPRESGRLRCNAIGGCIARRLRCHVTWALGQHQPAANDRSIVLGLLLASFSRLALFVVLS